LSLAQLLEGSGAAPVADLGAIFGLNSDSRRIELGELFFALPGAAVHGNRFIPVAPLRW
jgi:UDP-N-acetylmuramoyl-L-alanyl-D-glutamate--2,6-diaminopimelate ligase